MQWIEVTIKTAPGAIDLVCDRLTVLGFDSFIVDDQDQFHEFLEENRQYWDYVDEGLEQQMQGLSQIRLYLEEGPAVPETISHLKDQLAALRAQYPATDFGSLDVQLANVKDEDWENNWKQYYQPLPIGEKLLVVPEWLHPENPEHRVEVLLDPGMIFGTGAHASTQMCMRELERAIQGGEQRARPRQRQRHFVHHGHSARRGPRHGRRYRSQGRGYRPAKTPPSTRSLPTASRPSPATSSATKP